MSSNTDEPVIEIENLSFAYGPDPVLADVHLQIESGEFVSIVGPNGGGKTTLMRLILGLLEPSQGSVKLFGQPPARSRHRVGYMPQSMMYDAEFPASVIDVVLMGRLGGHRGFGPFRRSDRRGALRSLEEVGLADLARRPIADLSGGQRQRVLIARALASDPDLLMLDEPTNNIDLKAADDLYELLSRLNQRLTVVMVTHDIGFVSAKVRSVICVNRQVQFHPTSEITGECIREIYGSDVQLIRHDHRCSAEGHEWKRDS
ncbi:MAG: ABC transporter ATP-binding protein [Deltaproteobacteria bacterium]|nr:ABC transporter ATP-binding protein [Deltaproteobacteria bacterium]